jgi:hypothetical protein
MIHGKWILSYKWIIHSLMANQLLNEEDFEIYDDGHALGTVMKSRLGVSYCTNQGRHGVTVQGHGVLHGRLIITAPGKRHPKPGPRMDDNRMWRQFDRE